MKCPKCGSKHTGEYAGNPHKRKCMKCLSSFYDGKTEDVTIDLSDEDFIILAKMAHENDITFNELVCNILREEMEKEEKPLKEYRKSLRVEFDDTVDLQAGPSYSAWLERKLYDLEKEK